MHPTFKSKLRMFGMFAVLGVLAYLPLANGQAISDGIRKAGDFFFGPLRAAFGTDVPILCTDETCTNYVFKNSTGNRPSLVAPSGAVITGSIANAATSLSMPAGSPYFFNWPSQSRYLTYTSGTDTIDSIGTIKVVGATLGFLADTASGNNAYRCSNSGCRLSLGDTSDYMYHDTVSGRLSVATGLDTDDDPALTMLAAQATDPGQVTSAFFQHLTTAPHHVHRKKATSWHTPDNSTSIAVVGWMPSLSTDGTISAAPTADVLRSMVTWTTDGTLNDEGGWIGPYTATRPSRLPAFGSVVRTGSAVTDSRIWVALTSASLLTSDTNNAIHFAGFRCSSVAADTNWQYCASNGTTQNCGDTGVACSASTTYIMYVDCNAVSTYCIWYLNHTLVGAQTWFSSSSAVTVGGQVAIRATAAAVKTITVSGGYMNDTM